MIICGDYSTGYREECRNRVFGDLMSTAYELDLAGSSAAVLREADALFAAGGRLRGTHERLSRRLASMGIAHSLVRGFAVFLHGLRRFTEDLDMLVTPADLAALTEALIGNGYVAVPGNAKSIRDATTGVRIDFLRSGEYPAVFPVGKLSCDSEVTF